MGDGEASPSHLSRRLRGLVSLGGSYPRPPPQQRARDEARDSPSRGRQERCAERRRRAPGEGERRGGGGRPARIRRETAAARARRPCGGEQPWVRGLEGGGRSLALAAARCRSLAIVESSRAHGTGITRAAPARTDERTDGMDGSRIEMGASGRRQGLAGSVVSLLDGSGLWRSGWALFWRPSR